AGDDGANQGDAQQEREDDEHHRRRARSRGRAEPGPPPAPGRSAAAGRLAPDRQLRLDARERDAAVRAAAAAAVGTDRRGRHRSRSRRRVGWRAAPGRRDSVGQRQDGVERRRRGARAAESAVGPHRADARLARRRRSFCTGEKRLNANSRLADLIRERGPLTVAAFMDLALYDSVSGYYARAARRSGRAGDFFTSVDVGPLFGELIAVQLAEMFELLEQSSVASRKSSVAGRESSVASRESSVASRESSVASRKSSVASRESSVASRRSPFDLVEAGAGDARLSADILRAARERQGAFYGAVRLHLVEASAPARAAQCDRLGDVGDRLASSGAELPASFEGVLI